MNTEAFITDAASRGWSKTQTRQALNMSTYKFWAILAAMPPLEWAGRGHTLGNKLGNANKRVTPAILDAVARARASRRDKALHTWNGHTGTVEELAPFSPASARTIRRRLAAGLSVDEAFGAKPKIECPVAGWRCA